jgi:hypothetical protein
VEFLVSKSLPELERVAGRQVEPSDAIARRLNAIAVDQKLFFSDFSPDLFARRQRV